MPSAAIPRSGNQPVPRNTSSGVTVRSSIFGHLEASLDGFLDDVAHRAVAADDASAVRLGRYELPRIVAALRAVLNEHEPNASGRCHTCRTRRFGRPAAPCRAYLTAHLRLLVNEDDQDGAQAITPADLRHHLGASG
jgi:hypothetical protein